MIFSYLHMAWGIVLMKYHDPDQLQLFIHTTHDMPVWTCKNTGFAGETIISIDVPVCIEDTFKEWKEKAREALAPYEAVNGLSVTFARNTEAFSVSELEDPWKSALEIIMDIDRQQNSHLHNEISADRFKGHLMKVYEALLRDEETPIKDIEMVVPEERLQLLYAFNQTLTDYEKDQTIHSRFGMQAAAYPEQIAVVCNKESISYAELDRKSTQLAIKLRSRGLDGAALWPLQQIVRWR